MGTSDNAGAILVLGRYLVVVPKLIRPPPLAISSPESRDFSRTPYKDTWMQELNANITPAPTRGRPQVANDRVICT
ncbi:serine/threonine-protein phosphatase BSL2 homolog [Primulina tabacum]|uniref:serine/threonine-protein phosphatase BSL2 homolog n=1 Tax=Primulina tabacum TaxID=48773 RepID=UPI003F5AD451